MAISPPGDLVLDVVRAADPAKVREAHRNLLEKSTAGTSTAFDLAAGRPVGADVRAGDTESVPQSYRDFEAMVLQTFIQSMLPKDATNTFGEGTAGDMWKGMMAEQLGRALSEGGGIGIARQLAEDARRNQQMAQPAETSAGDVNFASRLVQQIQMGFLRDTAMSTDATMAGQDPVSST